MLESQHILQRFLFFLQFMKNPWKKCEKIFKKTLVFPTRTYYNGGTIPASAGYIISRRKTYEKEAEAAAAATLHDVREAMRINYFDDEALMNQPYEKQH